jgi:hypothetical protein
VWTLLAAPELIANSWPAPRHYRARAATDAVAKAFPDHYLYEDTPIPQATWRVAQGCVAVEKRGKRWVFVQGDGTPELPAATA